MRYAYDEDHETYRAEVARFGRTRSRRTIRATTGRRSSRRQQALDMAAMGLTGLRIPEAHGGQEATRPIAGIATPGDRRHDFNASYLLINTALISDVPSAMPRLSSRPCPKRHRLRRDHIPCLCITEPGHGTDAAAMALSRPSRLMAASGGCIGEKTSITLGMAADRAVVLARTGGLGARGIQRLLADLHDPSVTRSAFDDPRQPRHRPASLHFDGTPVGPDALIGAEGGGFVSVMQASTTPRDHRSACIGAAEQSSTRRSSGPDQVAFGNHRDLPRPSFPLAECATYPAGRPPRLPRSLWRRSRPRPLRRGGDGSSGPKLATEVILPVPAHPRARRLFRRAGSASATRCHRSPDR